MSEKTTNYNGWTNRATWVVNLWLNNDEYLQSRLMSIVNGDVSGIDKDHRLEELVNNVVEQQELEVEQTLDGFLLDLINTTLSQVNWTEIVDNNKDEE